MLTSLQNPLIKQVRKLHQSKERHRENLHLLEGTNLIAKAVELNYPLVTVLTTELWQKKHPDLWEKLPQQTETVETVSPELMEKLATTVNPDGVVATAYRHLCQKSPPLNLHLGLILERIQDPGNLGTIIRTCVAFNVDFLWLSSDSVDIDNPKVVRSSVGEWFKINAQVEENLPVLVEDYRRQGYGILATDLQGNDSFWDVDFTTPTILLVGNESRGLSQNLLDLATQRVKIPLSNGVESLNAAIATALILGEYRRQRNY